jgi:hypothetical protein
MWITWVRPYLRMTLAAEMPLGDVLLFQSVTVHKGVHNRSGDRIRLPMSARYQGRSQPIDAGALTPHMNWTEWDDIYESWPSETPSDTVGSPKNTHGRTRGGGGGGGVEWSK